MKVTKKQWGDLSKFFYTLSQLTYGGFGISLMVSKEPNVILIMAGIIWAVILAIIGFILGKGGDRDE
jgi:hypothetical protein